MGMDAFHGFLAGHITTGAVGLVAFWVPVLSKKGGVLHLRWGRIFNVAMIATGAFATGMALCTIADPLGTHPFMTDAPLVAGIFGWMMLYLAFLTVNLAVYGWLCIRYRRRHEAHRQPLWIASQALLFVAAANCAWQGWLLEQVLMMGISVVGIAAAATNLYFMFQRDPVPWGWQLEHQGPRGRRHIRLHGLPCLRCRASYARARPVPGALVLPPRHGAGSDSLPPGPGSPTL